MTEFIVSLVVMALSMGVYHWYEKKTPLDKRFSWGEAMIASVYVFYLFFWAYGVVPHFWLQWADSGLAWRADVILEGPHIPFLSVTTPEGEQLGIIASQQDGGWFPFRIPYLVIRDLVAVGIHVVFLGLNIFYWHHWQSRDARAKAAEAEVEAPSQFGRPLIREAAR